ncbi:MAG: hypothetical protein SOZ32_00470 [Bacilli bacterium]|nr:hypothetical protein [Bacilli bacterium]
MKKIKSLQIIFILFMFLIIATSCGYDCYIPVEKYQKLEGEEAYTEGDGKLDSPYVIDTKGKLIYLSNQTNEDKGQKAYYELQADIDLKGINWNPIKSFEGHFNGNGYEISNFVIKNEYPDHKYYTSYIGLFEVNYGTIERLGVTNFDIDVYWTRRGMCPPIGGIVALNYSVIKDCYAIGRISGICTATIGNSSIPPHTRIKMGGIAGKFYEYSPELKAEIVNCYSNIDIDDYVKSRNSYEVIANRVEATHRKIINCTGSGYYKKEYYTNELGWSEDIWDFDNPEFQNGGYLKLKRNK